MPVDIDALMAQHCGSHGSLTDEGRYHLVVALETWDPHHEIWEVGPRDTRVLMQSNSLHRMMARAHDLIASTDEIGMHLSGRTLPSRTFPYVQVFVCVWDSTDDEEVDLIDVERYNQGAVAAFMGKDYAAPYVDALTQIFRRTP